MNAVLEEARRGRQILRNWRLYMLVNCFVDVEFLEEQTLSHLSSSTLALSASSLCWLQSKESFHKIIPCWDWEMAQYLKCMTCK